MYKVPGIPCTAIDYLFKLASEANCGKSLHSAIIYHKKYGILSSGNNLTLKGVKSTYFKSPKELTVHAEMKALINFKKKHNFHLLSESQIFIMRVSCVEHIPCKISLSKPCDKCEKRLLSLKKKYGIKKVWWTTGDPSEPWDFY